MNYTVRPIDVWPGALRTDSQRTGAQFTAGWGDTVDLLDRELRALKARNVVLMLDVSDRDVRLDGQLRADARPGHPGVIIAFDSVHGPLKYATDIYNRGAWRRQGHLPGWQCNVRAVALGLEALRKVDRYGITKRGEQYTGWKALGSATPMPAAGGFTSIEDAAAFLARQANEVSDEGYDAGDLLAGPGLPHAESVQRAYRIAAKRLHPDVGGTPEDFQRLDEAYRMLVGER